jgi:hypothetical protein
VKEKVKGERDHPHTNHIQTYTYLKEDVKKRGLRIKRIKRRQKN